jgi:hypothetical protein
MNFFQYVPLQLKVWWKRLTDPKCHWPQCEREAADWSLRYGGLCEWHFNTVVGEARTIQC